MLDKYLDGVAFARASKRSRAWTFRIFPESCASYAEVVAALGFAGGRGFYFLDDSPSSGRNFGGSTIFGCVFFDHPMPQCRISWASVSFMPTALTWSEWERYFRARCMPKVGRDLKLSADHACEFYPIVSMLGGADVAEN